MKKLIVMTAIIASLLLTSGNAALALTAMRSPTATAIRTSAHSFCRA